MPFRVSAAAAGSATGRAAGERRPARPVAAAALAASGRGGALLLEPKTLAGAGTPCRAPPWCKANRNKPVSFAERRRRESASVPLVAARRRGQQASALSRCGL